MRTTICNAWRTDRRRLSWLLPWLLPWLTAACSEDDVPFAIGGYRYPADGLTQWALPRELREVSGLTLDAEGRLFAHADEAAIVFELDYRAGRAVRRFTLGDPPRPGDFEGIAWAGDRLFLVTSDGDLLEAEAAADGGHADYRLHRTGLGRRCEIEGLDYDDERRLLLMACKTAREKGLKQRLAVLAWSLDSLAAAPEHDIVTPLSGTGGTRMNPSGLTRSPGNGHLILTAARQHALIELSADGSVVRSFELPRRDEHPQMEGIALTPAGDLLIADEGQGKRGRLSVYQPGQ
jgi:uncharacterized protein YjiK